MKTFTFRVTQDSKGYYNGEVCIKASSEKAARNKLKKMSQKELEEISHNWEQGDDTYAAGDIEIEELKDEEEE